MTPLTQPEQSARLTAVKLLHTIVWGFFVSFIFAIPISAAMDRFDTAAVCAGVVCVEVLVLVINGMKCPLTAVAARYTTDRRANFDIYLPEWLAKYNKEIFGPLFVLGVVFAFVRWKGWLI
jgi:flagellar motor component MotA